MIIAIIPAKGGSKRLPNKNMQLIHGRPMIYYSLKTAKECNLIKNVYVSTDSEEIEAYAFAQGVEVIRRGSELAGEAPVSEVYLHALKVLNDPSITYVIGIQPDHPDRKVRLEEAINYTIEKGYDEVITVDGKGFVNGSLKIMKAEAMLNNRLGTVGTITDNCTNIHTLDDLKQSENNLAAKEIDL
ncbi:MAG: CMP-N,N'-diacetyllegionaminic acid synthase [Candidatus Scalindua rubra]|uniref:CMP-N,N'-diacetyllegionaminic acid synthase n=1 Tax=Candidatus Scalindua rubra TaxID=1872076 RepID=A0A1E3XDT1_9BACT|nr:MAG: CMP-N,N'-diacetyllegionaminic acid synthase [Candidatus Scalindua rubra]